MPSLSYQEKSLYGSLGAEVVVYGSYFLLQNRNSVNKIAGMILGLIVLQIILQALIAGFTRNRIKDERDRLIELRGYRAGYLTLASLMVVGLGMFWLHSAAGQIRIDNRALGLHFLTVFFSMLVIAGLVKTVTQIAAYRRAL